MANIDEPGRWERVLGGRVKDLRNRRGWTQSQLSGELSRYGYDLSQSTITKLEAGSRPTTIGEAQTLARIFGVSLGEMLEGANDELGEALAVDAGALKRSVRDLVDALDRLDEARARVAALFDVTGAQAASLRSSMERTHPGQLSDEVAAVVARALDEASEAQSQATSVLH